MFKNVSTWVESCSQFFLIIIEQWEGEGLESWAESDLKLQAMAADKLTGKYQSNVCLSPNGSEKSKEIGT